ncbi:MAG: glycerophosphodiester phosphodiesterase [Lachnospiraceae bacterium]|nr:glycerophosphodiester phosphodiesterase [Lachnospiraceae bacterium]
MRNVNKLFKIIRLNWRCMVEFELLYRFFSVLIFAPILLIMFNISMTISGYKYITVDNVNGYIKSPITIIMVIMLVLTVTFFALMEISANIYIIDQSYQRNITNIKDVLIFSLRNAIRAFSIRNIFLAIMVMATTLFLNTGITSGYISTVSVPGFFTAFITANKYLKRILYATMILSAFFFIKWIYVFQYFTLEKCSFVTACKKSNNLNKGHKLKDFVTILLMEMLCTAVFAAVTALVVLIFAGIYKFFSSYEIVYYMMLSAVIVVTTMLGVLFLALSMPMLFACISVMFYRHKVETGERIQHCMKSKYRVDIIKKKKIKRLEHIIFWVSLAVCTVYVYMAAAGNISLNVEYLKSMEITAHRGASAKYPENSMSAFEGAVELGADWIELDVQQTKDGEIIVMHDSNFKRTTGKNCNVWKMKYEDVENLDCGKWFSKDYKGERVPLLKDVVEYAKAEGIKLNIELKPTGHEKDFEKAVIDIVNEYEYKNRCVITSQNYKALKNVKKYDEEITTVYVMGVAYGNILKLTAADNFSIKYYYATDELIKRVHNAGKELYVWTVNSESSINKMIDLNVDNIITDNISLAKKCIYRKKAGNKAVKYFDKLLLKE